MKTKKVNRCLIIGLAVGWICLSLTSHGQAQSQDELIVQGQNDYRNGNYDQAVGKFEAALKTLTWENHPSLYIDTLVYISACYQALGHHQKALALIEPCKSRMESESDDAVCARFWSTLADIHLSLGERKKSVGYLEKGIRCAENVKIIRVQAVLLNHIGNSLAAYGFYVEAIQTFKKALELMKAISDQFDFWVEFLAKLRLNILHIKILSNVPISDVHSGELNSLATHILNQPDSHSKGILLLSLGQIALEILKKSKDNEVIRMAYQSFDLVATIGESIPDERMVSNALGYMGQLYEIEMRIPEAIHLTRRALFEAQQMRSIELMVQWQWQLGRLFKMQQNTELALSAYRSAVSLLTPVCWQLTQGYRIRPNAFETDIKPVYLGLADLLLHQAENAPDEATRRNKLEEARDTMETMKTAELRDFFKDECVVEKQKQQTSYFRLPPKNALIYPIMFSDRLVLLLDLPDEMTQVSVPVESNQLTKDIRKYNRRLRDWDDDFESMALKLYNYLIKPVELELKAHEIDTLIIAPEGVLCLVPFATLYDGNQYLIQKYALAIIPAMGLTETSEQSLKQSKILLTGLSKSVKIERWEFPTLPIVPKELESIRKMMGGNQLLDENYTTENLSNQLRQNEYSIVHMATHGYFGENRDERFLLTHDGKLTMDQLERLIQIGRFRKKNIQLLTLSACQTAQGSERAAFGLAGVAVKAGVSTAIATLWEVDDKASFKILTEFYRHIQDGVPKAKALQQSQMMLLKESDFWHPAYWSPFLLIGNWL